MGVRFADGKTLRVPGPSPVPHRIAAAQSRPIIGHRSSEFSSLFKHVQSRLQQLFETQSDVLVIAGTGTAGMESAVANVLSPEEPCVVLSGGKFGERWIELVEAFGARPIVFEYEYGHAADPNELHAFLQQHPDANVIFATQNESSTGVLNDIKSIAQVARQNDRLLAVDAVSSLGGTPLPMDDWGVDVVVTGSQKCLMLPPGLAFVGVSERAWEKAEQSQGPRYYFDWFAYRDAGKTNQSPYTSAVSLVAALDEALTMIEEEGMDARFDRHRLMRAMVREGLKALGFPMYVNDDAASPTLTAVRGDGVDVERLRSVVASKTEVVLAGGQGEMRGEIFRVGHMGAATPLDMVTTVGAIELGLAAIGHDVQLGTGTGRALEVWHTWP